MKLSKFRLKALAILLFIIVSTPFLVERASATIYTGSNTQTWVIPNCSLDVAVDDESHILTFLWSGSDYIVVPLPALFFPILSFWEVYDDQGFSEYDQGIYHSGTMFFEYTNQDTWLTCHVKWNYNVGIYYILVDCWVNLYIGSYSYDLTISSESGGTTEPPTGTYAYSYGESVTVTASTYPGYAFTHWVLDGETRYGNPITVTMNSDRTLRACFQYEGGGGCPILSVYSGTGYVEEGLLDIHNPDGIDVITSHVLIHTPEPVEHRYLLRLTEHPQTYSHLDQVQLFAMLTNGTEVKLPLVSAVHSEDGNVKQELLVSDDVRAVMLGEDYNNGTSQYIDVEFVAPDELEIETFTFIIEGHNIVYKV